MYIFPLGSKVRLFVELIYIRHFEEYVAHKLCYTCGQVPEFAIIIHSTQHRAGLLARAQ